MPCSGDTKWGVGDRQSKIWKWNRNIYISYSHRSVHFIQWKSVPLKINGSYIFFLVPFAICDHQSIQWFSIVDGCIHVKYVKFSISTSRKEIPVFCTDLVDINRICCRYHCCCHHRSMNPLSRQWWWNILVFFVKVVDFTNKGWFFSLPPQCAVPYLCIIGERVRVISYRMKNI